MQKQVWLVTGSSRGIGRALCEAVLAEGHLLVATARDTSAIADLAAEHGDNVHVVSLDVTDAHAASRAIDAAAHAFGKLDVLVNNAGFGNVAPIEDTSLEDIREQIETNLFGVINMTRAAIPVMRVQGNGHIIQISSVGGRVGAMGRAAYSAAKWGVEGFSESLAKETAPLGIRVSIVEPGGFRTDFAGSSSKLATGRPEYDTTVGAAARMQLEYNGRQPGDPKKAAEAIIHIASLSKPPLRLLLGSDAFSIVEKNDLAKIENDRKWKATSISTDFNE